MSDGRKDIINKIESHRRTIREHVEKHAKFKKDGYGYSYTGESERTIRNAQNQISDLICKLHNFSSSWEDNWSPN